MATEKQLKNLMPIQKVNASKTREQRVASARKAGKRSGEVRREKKLWREEIMKRLGNDDWNDIVDTLIRNAKVNGGKDFEILRDTMGQKPVENKEETTQEIQRVQIINDLPGDDNIGTSKN